MRRFLACVLLCGCAGDPPPAGAPPADRYRDAWVDFRQESDAVLRFAGRNRLRVEGSAGRARAALDVMRSLLEPEPAARLAEVHGRFDSLARGIANANAVSSGQELAMRAVRDEVERDFAPAKAALTPDTPPPPPVPAPADAFARWEEAHQAFAEAAGMRDSARIVQEYSSVRAATEGLAERFLREYERVADLVQSGAVTERDLKGIPVLEADVRAAFGAEK
jgi:hypothetical protein